MSYAEDLISAYVAATNTTSFERGLKYSSFFLEKVCALLAGPCLEWGMRVRNSKLFTSFITDLWLETQVLIDLVASFPVLSAEKLLCMSLPWGGGKDFVSIQSHFFSFL